MAEYFLRSFDSSLKVFSAGTFPSKNVHPIAIQVMSEIDIDLHDARPKNVDEFLTQSFDFVITVCDNAKETCPCFFGNVTHRLHIGFEDPAEYTGTEVQILNGFKKVRDEIRENFFSFYQQHLKQQ